MFSPNCFGDPASTDDRNFFCGQGDNGGVHYNSGVLNQVYSLFVDGGEFRGTTYTGVGLIKAFHIFVRGLAKHVPTATFAQNSDYNQAVSTEYNYFQTLCGIRPIQFHKSRLIYNTNAFLRSGMH